MADEKSRERKRRYRESHREQIRESARDYTRQYYAANRAEILERKREKDRERGPREYTEEMREYNRRYHAEHRDRLYQQSKRKVARDALLSQLWVEQGGLCYLCEKPVTLERAVLEHDHDCCPGWQFCRYCARGAAHQRCNTVVGIAGDDPEQLERIAANLRARSAELLRVRGARPVQATLLELGEGRLVHG